MGNTIGGILSPVVGIIGAILVYMALKEQVNANLEVQRQISDDKESKQLNKYLDYLIKSIDNFKFEKTEYHSNGDKQEKKI